MADQQLNPPRAPTPAEEDVPEAEPVDEEVPAPSVEPDVAVAGVPPITPSGSFHFMQASELEATPFEDGAEWVDRSDAAEHQAEPTPQPVVPEENALNGHIEGSSDVC